MNYTEMLFNRDERLVNLLNQADSKNLELIEEINNREDEIERLHSIINKSIEYIENYINQFNGVYPPVDMRYLDLHKLLGILKGVNKE